jgi:DNA repair photolyase
MKDSRSLSPRVISIPKMETRLAEIQAKSILNKSGITDWTVNCYSGCEHGCLYCYARFATRFSHPRERWGSFVDVKVNAPQVLEREVNRKRVGRVFMSSVCDGWQPVEEKYGLTRRCLEILLQHSFPITILTKSALAGRDLDLLAGKNNVDFGVTITTLDESLSKLFESKSSPPAERLALAEEAKTKGITTYVFLGPLIPHLSDTEESLRSLLHAVREVGADYFYVDRLNPRYGVWPSLKGLLQEYLPHLTEEYKKILFNGRVRERYSEELVGRLSKLAKQAGLSDKMSLIF